MSISKSTLTTSLGDHSDTTDQEIRASPFPYKLAGYVQINPKALAQFLNLQNPLNHPERLNPNANQRPQKFFIKKEAQVYKGNVCTS